MKKLLTITAICSLCVFVNAQAPQALNYQAVARTADGVIIPTQNIGVRFSILDGSVTGTTLYSETHTVITNSYGLFTLSIGKGTPVTSTFANVNWASGTDKFLKVEIAPAGGTTYQLQGTTQLLSVPYALYSEKTRLLAGNNTINITNGNTITGNYQAGFGTGITGNVISHTLWNADANGINYQGGNVGIGGTSSTSAARLTIQQAATGGFSGAMDIFSNDTYQTVTRFRNTTVNQEYQFNLAGTTNSAQPAGSFGVFHSTNLRWVWYTNPTNSFLGVGSSGVTITTPKSRLHVFNGDVNIDQIGSGIIMKSPNGSCWRTTVENTGALVSTAITCPN
jgi:hypothetical protein